MHEVLVNRLGGLSLPRKSVVRLTDRPDMTLDVYRGRKTTMQQVFSFTFLRYFRYVMWPDRRRIHISATSFLFHLHAGEAGEVHVQRCFQSESPV